MLRFTSKKAANRDPSDSSQSFRFIAIPVILAIRQGFPSFHLHWRFFTVGSSPVYGPLTISIYRQRVPLTLRTQLLCLGSWYSIADRFKQTFSLENLQWRLFAKASMPLSSDWQASSHLRVTSCTKRFIVAILRKWIPRIFWPSNAA